VLREQNNKKRDGYDFPGLVPALTLLFISNSKMYRRAWALATKNLKTETVNFVINLLFIYINNCGKFVKTY